jgi:carboxyl-terminal processing protease
MFSWFFKLSAVSAALVMGSSAPAVDDLPKASQGSYVVIVGVSETTDKTIQPRPTADVDATAVYDLFTDKKYSDVAADRVVLLTSVVDEKRKSLKSTRENILKAVHDAFAKTGKDDTVILAMFGRGAAAGERTVFFAADSSFKEREKDAVLGTDLETELKTAKQQRIALLLDIHFKGYDAGKEAVVEPNLRDITGGLFGGEEKGEQPIPPNRLLMLGTIPTADPFDVGKNSLFTATLLNALQGTADVEGYEPDGIVTVDEMVKYLEKEMQDQARKLGKNKKEKEAAPFIVGEELSHFPLTKNPKITESVDKRLKALDNLETAGSITKELAAEGHSLLHRMPKLKSPQELRKRFQDLADGKITPEVFAADYKAIKEKNILAPDDADEFANKVLRAISIVDEKYVKKTLTSDLTVAAIRGMYRRLEEGMPKEIDDKLKESKGMTSADMKAVLKAARLQLGVREDIAGDKDADIAITMMLGSLKDPHTVYYDFDTIKKEDSRLRGNFSGVGIQIRSDIAKDAILVVSPIKGSPAYKAGIQAGDYITGIKRDSDPEGKALSPSAQREFTTKGMKIDQALEIILGKAGVPITLVVERDGESKDYVLERGRVSVETVLGVKRNEKDDWSFYIDPTEKIAYIHLTQFAPQSAAEIATVMQNLNSSGLKGMILDLRNNPGGTLQGALMISSMFIEGGKVVTVRERDGREDVLTSKQARIKDTYTKFPMAVLINGGSASASEIVSACLQDYNRAVIVGERSYGKGSVQQVMPFNMTKGQMKLTTARYFPPSDKNIDKYSTGGKPEDEWGVKPDKGYEVKLPKEELRDFAEYFRERELIPKKVGEPAPKKEYKDKQLETALEYVRDQMKLAAKKER